MRFRVALGSEEDVSQVGGEEKKEEEEQDTKTIVTWVVETTLHVDPLNLGPHSADLLLCYNPNKHTVPSFFLLFSTFFPPV